MMVYLTWLEIVAGEGARWPEPTTRTYTQLVVMILALVAIGVYLKFYYSRRTKKIHEEQFFLFKARQKGLTKYQSKIVQGMVKNARLKNPDALLNDEVLFENSITRFLNYVTFRGESGESLYSIFHDIIITYEKIFHHAKYKKPLVNLVEVENNILMYFITEYDEAYIARLRRINHEFMVVKILKTGGSLAKLVNQPVTVHLWRSGDAEYSFKSKVQKIDRMIAELSVPSEFTRGKEVFHPYVNVFIPCNIMIKQDEQQKKEAVKLTAEEQEEMDRNAAVDKILAEEAAKKGVKELAVEVKPDLTGDIVKINENEAVIRFENRIDFRMDYIIDFDMEDFHYKITANPVSDKIIERDHVYNYTFRFKEISDNALKVLRNFLAENLH